MNKLETPASCYKEIEGIFIAGHIEEEPHLFKNVVLSDHGRMTIMSCVGFIIATHASGNINLAYQLAYNLCYQIQTLAPRDNIRKPGMKYGHTYKLIYSDCNGLSLTFGIRKEIDMGDLESFRNEYPHVHINEVHHYGNVQYFYQSLHGGIIFHGHRKIHALESYDYNGLHARWWCTHT